VIPNEEIQFWSDWDNSIFVLDIVSMPEDFVSFDDDRNTVIRTNNYGDRVMYECYDTDYNYKGYKQLQFFAEGDYSIAYKARWYTFTKDLTDDVVLDIPYDVLDCIPSYIAHQCYKIDDENKAAIFRNEYEMFLSRIDDTHFKQSTTFMTR
jgi:hypothetical protein